MSLYDDVYRESLHDWLAEREPPDRPARAELADDDGGCGHDGWVAGCPACEREHALALDHLGEPPEREQ